MSKITAPLTFPVWIVMVIAHKNMAKNGDPLADIPALANALRVR